MRVTDWIDGGTEATYLFELTPEEIKLWPPIAGNTVQVSHRWYGDERETDWYDGATNNLIEAPGSLPNYAYANDYYDEVIDSFDTAYQQACRKRKIDQQMEAAKQEAIQNTGGGITPPLFTTVEEAEAWLEKPTPADIRDQVTRLIMDAPTNEMGHTDFDRIGATVEAILALTKE